MKKATIREVQHNFSRVLKWVEDGEEVYVMRRKQDRGPESSLPGYPHEDRNGFIFSMATGSFTGMFLYIQLLLG